MPMILSPAKDGAPIVIDKAVIMIGRHPTCDVVLNDSRKVSRKHCCLVQVNDKFFVRDLGSMNGIKVNGKRVKKESQLNLGDLLTVGDVDYRFQLSNAAKKASQVAKQKPMAVEEVAPVTAGLADSGTLGPAVASLDDDDMPGLAPLESGDAIPVAASAVVVEPDIIELPEDDDDVVVVLDDEIDVIDEIEVVDEVQIVEDVQIIEDVEIVDDVVEVLDEVEVVDDDGFDIINIVEDDDEDGDVFEDVVLLDDDEEDDDFFDGPIEILE